VNYAKLLEISSFFTWHIFLEVGKTQDMPSKIWQTLEDALRDKNGMAYIVNSIASFYYKSTN